MNVLHLDTGREMRGGQELLLGFAAGLAARGHRQTIACPPGSPLFAAAQERGLAVVPMERSYLPARAAVLRMLEPGLIVASHDARSQTISYLASRGKPVVRVAHRHVAFAPRSPRIHRWKYMYTCDAIVATSEAAKSVLIGSGITPERIHVVRGGIEWPASVQPRTDHGLFTIGHAAAFTAEKGQSEALDALLALLPRRPDLRMVLLGEGPLRDSAEIRAKVRAAGPSVTLPGYRKVDGDFFSSIDVFLANSSSEALGLAALHAMAHGVPVIASAVGGLREVVGDTGWLIPPGDPAALARALEEAIGDPNRLQESGLRARERARLFSLDQSVLELEGVYSELLVRHLGAHDIVQPQQSQQ